MQKPLVISQFDAGIADSPHLGLADLHNLDTTSIPGVCFPNFKTTAAGGDSFGDYPTWIAQDPADGDLYALDHDGAVFKSTDNGQTWDEKAGYSGSSTNGDGLVVWKDYLLIFRHTKIDAYGPLSSSTPSYTIGWKTINGPSIGTASDFHPAIVGTDDTVYVGCVNKIATISEVSGSTFNPSNSGTYSFNAEALDLPSNVKVKCLAFLGARLMVGTIAANNTDAVRLANIYPWDTFSSSFTRPIQLAEFGIHQMLTVNDVLYAVAGKEGSIYRTVGSSTYFMRKLPRGVTNVSGGDYLRFYPGAICFHKGRIHFGVSGSDPSLAGLGVWSCSLDGRLAFEHAAATGTSSGADQLFITALAPVDSDSYLIARRDGTDYAIDFVDTSAHYGSRASYLCSALHPVGTPKDRKTFSRLQIYLDRPLSDATQELKVSARKHNSGSFTEICSFTHAGDGPVECVERDPKIQDAAFVQLKIEFSGDTPIHLKEIRLE